MKKQLPAIQQDQRSKFESDGKPTRLINNKMVIGPTSAGKTALSREYLQFALSATEFARITKS